MSDGTINGLAQWTSRIICPSKQFQEGVLRAFILSGMPTSERPLKEACTVDVRIVEVVSVDSYCMLTLSDVKAL